MKTNKIIFTILICFTVSTLCAVNTDSIKLVKLEQTLQKEITNRETLKNELAIQNKSIQSQCYTIDSLRSIIELNSRNIEITANKIGVKIDETNTSLKSKANAEDVRLKTMWGIILLVFVAILLAVVYFLLHKRIRKGTADVTTLQAKAKELNEKAEKLNEEILNQFAQEMAEMQKISSSLDALAKIATETESESNTQSSEPDHSLIKTLADRITFMEMTLYRMDPNVKGFKQLSKSIVQMKDNLQANGYELVQMLGKPYNEGMKVTANFIDDDSLEEGKQIITGIIKPQINYKGVMIQAAQITVSQNI